MVILADIKECAILIFVIEFYRPDNASKGFYHRQQQWARL